MIGLAAEPGCPQACRRGLHPYDHPEDQECSFYDILINDII
jgi:hypothetical protein